MPFLDASALDRDPDGLAFLKAVIAQPAANDRMALPQPARAAGTPLENARRRGGAIEVVRSMIVGVPVPSCVERLCLAEAPSGPRGAQQNWHQGRLVELCARLGAPRT
jgi:hypothetical protein